MTPTRPRALVLVTVVTAAVVFGVLRAWDVFLPLPGVPSSAPVTLLLLAVVVVAVALSLRTRLRQQRERTPEAKPVNPLAAARAVVLGKSSSLVGAIVAGAYVGYAGYLLPDIELGPYRARAIMCGFGVATAVLLLLAGLFLERVCRVPPSDREGNGAAEDEDAEDGSWRQPHD
ncbi:MAG: DUF3180 domain-containing protein [Streptomycetales bacterium]